MKTKQHVALIEKRTEFRLWKKWRRERFETLLEGEYTEPTRALVKFCKTTMTSPTMLIEFVKTGPWRNADSNVRAEILTFVAAVITARREKLEQTPFDDPLPGAPLNAFLILRDLLAPPPGRSPASSPKTPEKRTIKMSNDLTSGEPEDDGFHGSLSSTLSKRLNYVNWTDANGWTDRDGLPMPSPQLVFAVDEALRKWKDNKPEMIREKPLPDPEQLNAAIPRNEWEKGLDGNPRAPWEHVVIVCFVDPSSGKVSQYTAPTRGAHIAVDELKEQVITMRALRGVGVIPVVQLSDRPFKTNWGMRKRPHFHVVGWKSPGGDGPQAVPAKSPTPQLPGPTTTEKPSPAAAASPAVDSAPKPKPAVKLGGGETLDAMKDVTPPSTGEIMDDSVPW